jgi:Helicase HerA, central domain/TraM recognition site of TraD and TraG
MQSDSKRTVLRLAAVQIDYQPLFYYSGIIPITEPLYDRNLEAIKNKQDPFLNQIKLKEEDNNSSKPYEELCEELIISSKQTYLDSYRQKIEDILSYCFRHEVKLLIFPEYSIPVEFIPDLRKFSSVITIVAGITYIQSEEINYLDKLGIDTKCVENGFNVAVVLSSSGDYCVSKKHKAQYEDINKGNGFELLDLVCGDASYKVSISICKDYLAQNSDIESSGQQITIIPALSSNLLEFYKVPPRSCLTIFANHAQAGGTFISSTGVVGPTNVDLNGIKPLPASSEGIIILDWDYNNPIMPKLASLQTTVEHQVYAISEIIYSGRDEEYEICQTLNVIEKMMQNDKIDARSVTSSIKSVLSSLNKNKHKHTILKNSLETLLSTINNAPNKNRSLSRHCILRAKAITIDEWRYQQLCYIYHSLQKASQSTEVAIGKYLDVYQDQSRKLSHLTRLDLRETRHRIGSDNSYNQFTKDGENKIVDKRQFVSFVRLGSYTTSKALKSLTKQLTLLKTLSRLQDPELVICYRLRTVKDEFGHMLACFDIICTTQDCSEEDIEILREGFGQLIHITFTGAYSLSYSFSDDEYEKIYGEVDSTQLFSKEIVIINNSSNFLCPPDWGTIHDLLRSLKEPICIEMNCFAYDKKNDNLYEDKLQPDVYAHKALNARNILEGIRFDGFSSPKNLGLQIVISSPKKIPLSIQQMIGIEVSGGKDFKIVEHQSTLPIDLYQDSAEEILTVFHPSTGVNYGVSKKIDLNRVTTEKEFPSDGITIGKASIRTVNSDEEIDVKVSSEDRLKHTYVIGRTGSGKTNLLKSMASQDVIVPGRGVTIIDPHGDLIDHVLQQIPDFRQNEVTLIDLSRTDFIPVLNPLDLDMNESVVKDRTISELIKLLESRTYHQNTGPRFEDITRLVLETFLDSSYPEVPSLTEVTSFLKDKKLRKNIQSLLANKKIAEDWKFNSTFSSSDDTELIHWITAKFSDLTNDTTLKCFIGGGRSTFDIDTIVSNGGILLVKIPEATIGKNSSDFIGSLILLKLRMAIIRRSFADKIEQKQTPYHFVYVDEFQNFVNADFHTIVAEARKFNVGFTLAHQNLEQLKSFSRNTGMREDQLINSIIGNVGNIVVFKVGIYDADVFSRQLGVSTNDLMRIGKYEAVAKILKSNNDTDPFTLKPDYSPNIPNPSMMAKIENSMKGNNVWKERHSLLNDVDTRIDRVRDFVNEQTNANRRDDTENG